MVWFVCDSCGESIKKPKVPQHLNQCNAYSLTCVDCSRTFDRRCYAAHTSCVTESQKYAEGATKPGGFASKGFYESSSGGTPQAAASTADPSQDEFLSKRGPWKCSVCNVSCTSQETLHAHAAGKKHVRRAQAARNANGGATPSGQTAANGTANGLQATQSEPSVAVQNEAPATAAAPDSTAAAAPAVSAAADDANGKKGNRRAPKWKAIAAELLQANGGVLKLKKLQSKALKQAQLSGDNAKSELKSEMLAKWKASSQFEVGKDEVKLKV